MNLLFVSGEYPPDIGGVGDYTALLRQALAERGWPSSVLSRPDVGRWDARSLLALLRAAPRSGIVHIQYQSAAYDLLGDACLMPMVLRALRPGVRVVTTFHDARVPYLFPRAGALRRQAIRLLARSSDAVIAADERDLETLGAPPRTGPRAWSTFGASATTSRWTPGGCLPWHAPPPRTGQPSTPTFVSEPAPLAGGQPISSPEPAPPGSGPPATSGEPAPPGGGPSPGLARLATTLFGPQPSYHAIPIGSNVPCAPRPGYDRAALRATLGFRPDTLAIVYFGLLNASKGLDLLLDSFDLVWRQDPRARLLLLGGEVGASDPTDRLTAAAIHSRVVALGPRAVHAGWLPPSDLSAHLLAADIALLPYADGASGRRGSLLACAEHGLPIVTTQPAAPEVAQAIEAVPRSPAALAATVLDLAANPERLATLRQASKLLAARATWPAIADHHIAIYNSLT